MQIYNLADDGVGVFIIFALVSVHSFDCTLNGVYYVSTGAAFGHHCFLDIPEGLDDLAVGLGDHLVLVDLIHRNIACDIQGRR